VSTRDALGNTAIGVGLSGNTWYSGSQANLQAITGSKESTGHWLILNPSVSRDFTIHTNWTLSLHGDAQWASEPLISNEQYGAGGVASVRGYREGEVFGDTGWRTSIELKTPPQVVGIVYGKAALTVRGSVFTDYASTYLLDPQPGAAGSTSLWGAGFGGVAALGSHWELRLLFAWPLLSTTSTVAGQPRFNFALTGQF
jgi:hemolysin activation/secretion protein